MPGGYSALPLLHTTEVAFALLRPMACGFDGSHTIDPRQVATMRRVFKQRKRVLTDRASKIFCCEKIEKIFCITSPKSSMEQKPAHLQPNESPYCSASSVSDSFVKTVLTMKRRSRLLLTGILLGRAASFGVDKKSPVSLFRRGLPSSHFPALHSSLTSALESLDNQDRDDSAPLLQWMDPAGDDRPTTTVSAKSSSCTKILPLYPLPAVYLPNTEPSNSCLLRNTERRNVQMALDCGVGGEFCVVLRAIDTGRIATIGTVLRVVHLDVQRTRGSTQHRQVNATTPAETQATTDNNIEDIQRILVTCRPVSTVHILHIENPQAASLEHRLRHPDEYLWASVRVRAEEDVENTIVVQSLCDQIEQDYKTVRELYLEGVGADDLPPFCRDRLQEALPEDSCCTTPSQFWKIADVWQSLCETVREGRQLALAGDRNELLVDAAVRSSKGPLQLPIHLEDVPSADRRQVHELEATAQQLWWDLRLDPCLDFQKLLAMSEHEERIRHFAAMVARERLRLEELASSVTFSCSSSTATANTRKPTAEQQNMENRKGSWFEDDW